MIAKMMEALDGERFDILMEKNAQRNDACDDLGLSAIFLYVLIRMFTN